MDESLSRPRESVSSGASLRFTRHTEKMLCVCVRVLVRECVGERDNRSGEENEMELEGEKEKDEDKRQARARAERRREK